MMKNEQVFFNGEFLPLDEARIPVDDRAVLFGDSIFETIRGYRGRPFRLDRHLERLRDGCRLLRLHLQYSDDDLAHAVERLVTENGLDGDGDAYIRVTVTGGPPEGPKGLEHSGPPGLFILARPYAGYPEEMYRRGISLIISGMKKNSSSMLSSLKSANYLDSLLARQEALDQGADDAVLTTHAGNLAEATSSNLFMFREGNLMTPDVGCGFLPGVTREAVIGLCRDIGVTCTPVMAGIDVLLSSSEVFLTNSLMEIMPARSIARKPVGKACPGPVTIKLQQAYRDLVARELGI